MAPAGRIAAGLAAAALVAAGLVAVAARRRSRRPEVPSVPPGGPIPTRRSARNAQLVRAGARSGRDYAGMRVRSLLADDDRRAELAAEFELRTAEQVAESLGQMKGALMKLGQMASYLDQGLPEPVREALAQLQSDAPPMAPELAAEAVAAELGAPPGELFASWDDTPLASASIGQVHRAVTHDGRAVAVKVQYPGVDRAIAADLDNTDLLFSVMGTLFPALEPGPIVEEISQRVTEELDYRVEAGHQRHFADAYRGHPFIHVPEVLDELSTARVLTTELATGATFAEVTRWPDEERQLAAETLFRFAFGSIYGLAAFNGDPHPGNYLFRPGGEVTFLDYGLCKRFSPEEVSVFEDMIGAMVLDRDIAAYRQILDRLGILPAAAPFDDEEIAEYFGHFYEFVLEPGVMEITPEYASASVRRFFDVAGPHGDILKQANLPPSMVIIQRINLGLYALFADLGARNDWRAIAEELWPSVDAPPATPMGQRIAQWSAGRRDDAP